MPSLFVKMCSWRRSLAEVLEVDFMAVAGHRRMQDEYKPADFYSDLSWSCMDAEEF